MTNKCTSGGTGVPNTGQAAVVDYSAGLLAAIFAAFDIVWLIPVIPLVGLAPLTLTTFCDSTLPPAPTFTANEANAILQLNFTSPDFASGLSKAKDAILNAIWSYSCHCQTVAPVSYSPPAPPSGTGIFTTPPGLSGPCGATDGLNAPAVVGDVNCLDVWTIDPLDFQGVSLGISFTLTAVQHAVRSAFKALPSGVGFINASIASSNGCGNYFRGGFDIRNLNSVTGVNCIATEKYDSTGNLTDRLLHLDVYCGGQTPGSSAQPCCPPDTATQSYLDAILALTTLIQRQTAPFAYIAGTTHTALTGNGTISVQGLLGAKINPTTIPGYAGVAIGDPDTLWLDSWINWGNGDGWTAREFLRSAPHISLPAAAGQFTTIGYSLAPGLVVDITELQREP